MYQRNIQGAVHIVSGDDPLNLEHVKEVKQLLEACMDRGQPRAVLDLERVPLIDSAGLELLLDMNEEFARRGGSLKLATENPLCKEILSLTGVGRHFEIYSETAGAVSSFVQ